MIVVTSNEVITRHADSFKVSDPLGNSLMVLSCGFSFDCLAREELLLQFVEVQMAIAKTQVRSTKKMLKKYRAELLAQIQGNYAHL